MEHRRGTRAPFRGWVELTLHGQRMRGEACDLSAGGIGVALPGSAGVWAADGGTPPMQSEFALPGISLPLCLEARLVWSDPRTGRAGVRFVDMDPGLADLLANYVAGRL